jgi:hypothetical protein
MGAVRPLTGPTLRRGEDHPRVEHLLEDSDPLLELGDPIDVGHRPPSEIGRAWARNWISSIAARVTLTAIRQAGARSSSSWSVIACTASRLR